MNRTFGSLLAGVIGLLSTLPAACGGEEFGATGAGGQPSSTAASTSTGADVGGSGTGGSPNAECSAAADCPGEDTECRQRTCEGGVCGVADTPEGTPAATQIDGDCKTKVCDGRGTPSFKGDDRDFPIRDDNACTDGVCDRGAPLHVPTDPGTMCRIGVCDGTGTCVECLQPGDCTPPEICQLQSCVPATCNDSTHNGDETDVDCGGSCAGCANGKTCGGDGDCLSGFCGGGVCKPCLADADCASQQFCAAGLCKEDLDDAQPCATGAQCSSGVCADGVCCNVQCNQACTACTAAKKGQGNDGVCGPIGAGLDPDNECAQSMPATCGNDGQCNGAAACRKWILGTSCGVSCNNLQTAVDEKECNGAGQCLPVQQTSCMGYVCKASMCLTDCNGGDADCAQGFWCNQASITPECEPKKPDGDACFGDNECISNSCCMVVVMSGPGGVGTCSSMPCLNAD